MSINLGTAPVQFRLFQSANQLAAFTVNIPVVGELDKDAVILGTDDHPTRCYVTVTSLPNGVLERALRNGIEAFIQAFDKTLANRKESK